MEDSAIQLREELFRNHPLPWTWKHYPSAAGEILSVDDADGSRVECFETSQVATAQLLVEGANQYLATKGEGQTRETVCISVKQRADDYIAFTTDLPGFWEAGKTPEEAIGRFVLAWGPRYEIEVARTLLSTEQIEVKG